MRPSHAPSAPEATRFPQAARAARAGLFVVLGALAPLMACKVGLPDSPDAAREAAVDSDGARLISVPGAGATINLRQMMTDAGATVIQGLIYLSPPSPLQQGSGIIREYDLPKDAAPWVKMVVAPTGTITLLMEGDPIGMVFRCLPPKPTGGAFCPGAELPSATSLRTSDALSDGGPDAALLLNQDAGILLDAAYVDAQVDLSDAGMMDAQAPLVDAGMPDVQVLDADGGVPSLDAGMIDAGSMVDAGTSSSPVKPEITKAEAVSASKEIIPLLPNSPTNKLKDVAKLLTSSSQHPDIDKQDKNKLQETIRTELGQRYNKQDYKTIVAVLHFLKNTLTAEDLANLKAGGNPAYVETLQKSLILAELETFKNKAGLDSLAAKLYKNGEVPMPGKAKEALIKWVKAGQISLAEWQKALAEVKAVFPTL